MKKFMAGIILAVLMVAGTAWGSMLGQWVGTAKEGEFCLQLNPSGSISQCDERESIGQWNVAGDTVTLSIDGETCFRGTISADETITSGYFYGESVTLFKENSDHNRR